MFRWNWPRVTGMKICIDLVGRGLLLMLVCLCVLVGVQAQGLLLLFS